MNVLNLNGAILKTDFSIPYSQYKSILDNSIGNGNPYEIDYRFTQTAKGLDLLETKFIDTNNNEILDILFRANKQKTIIIGDVFKLKSRNSIEGTITNSILQALCEIAIKCAGTIMGYSNYKDDECHYETIVDGVSQDYLKQIEENGTVNLETFNGPKVNITIKQYIENNENVKQYFQSHKTTDQIEMLNKLALFLLTQKAKEEISFDVFIDLFNQCCILGANDKNVLNFYKILKQ